MNAPADDLISVLTAAELDGVPLSRGYLDAYYLILMVAGNETTRNLLSGGGVNVLSENPQWWDFMRENPPAKIRVVVEEMVRWVSPVLSMRRTATRDLEMHGKTIRQGDKVVMWFCSANRDERAFENPETFVGNRFPNEHVGFGWGRACLSRLEPRADGSTAVLHPRHRARTGHQGARSAESIAEQLLPWHQVAPGPDRSNPMSAIGELETPAGVGAGPAA